MTADLLIREDMRIRDALGKLQRTGEGVLLLVNERGTLLRTVTDGDLRRLILSGRTLEDSLAGLPEQKPATVVEGAGEVKALEILNDRQVEVDTALQCQPPGVPRIGPPAKIVQTAREVLFLYDDVNGSFFRIIPTDGRPHRKDLPASYLGDAIGRYEGDALVVETVNFNEDTWLTDNGAFHSKDLKVIERLRRVGDTVQYEATAYDPAVLQEPWKERTQTLWLSDREIEESPRCEDRDLDLIKDGSHHDNPR